MRATLALLAGVLLSSIGEAQGRGDYLNFETPQVKPITVARVAGHDYVLACNTPDNSLEIYDTVGDVFRFRIAVGLEPVSVVYEPAHNRAYVCNMLGDSVSVIHLTAASPTAPLQATLERTVYVGDEPMCISFLPDKETAWVTLNQGSAAAWVTAITVAPFTTTPVDLVDNLSTPTKGIKHPRTILTSNGKVFVIGNKGSHISTTPQPGDMDLYGFDAALTQWHHLSNLGTLHYNMTAASNGDLYLVSGNAQNHIAGEANVAKEKFGFVRSYLTVVKNAGTASAAAYRRDINSTGGSSPVPVQPGESLAHPKDVAVFEQSGVVTKVYVAGFNVDRVGVIDTMNGSTTPSQWQVLKRIDIPEHHGSSNPMTGPRGLAVKYAISELEGDPGDRVYVLNRLDNSIAVLDPSNDTWIRTFKLQHDPTPQFIRTGRRFLYDNTLSKNNFVSCSSCHDDGTLDGQIWFLDNTMESVTFPAWLADGVTQDDILTIIQNGVFPQPKGEMVTQTLQGLVNWDVPGVAAIYATNAPYHWRGDRPTFQDFNPAFQGLLLRTEKLSTGEMNQFTDFINSISYPPNPEQAVNRVYRGTFGTAGQEDGSGAQRGMKLFHERALADCTGRSCVQCHALPEGSNNRVTELDPTTTATVEQPLETAALRFLRQKERVLVKSVDPAVPSTIKLAEFGLERKGNVNSINSFNAGAFAPEFPDPTKLKDVNQFVREFDTGVAPAVGFPYTIDLSNKNSLAVGIVFDVLEDQVKKANVGLAALVWGADGRRGFFYDIVPATPVYREEPGTLGLSRSGLLGLILNADHRIVIMATPLGSERRVAHKDGKPTVRMGPAPSTVTLEPMVPNTAYARVPELKKNWVPVALGGTFNWTGQFSTGPAPEPIFPKAIRLLQWGLKQDGPQFGLTELRHDAPRRLRVAGDNIRHGAKLELYVPAVATPPPYANLETSTTLIEVPIYPTEQTVNGKRVWETAVEFEPLMYYAFMHGGFGHNLVNLALAATLPEPPPTGLFPVATWNKHFVKIVNEDGTADAGAYHPLRL